MNTHPECFLTKKMFAETFEIGKNRIDDLARIAMQNSEAMQNGRSVIAPVRVWMEALKAYNEGNTRKRGGSRR